MGHKFLDLDLDANPPIFGHFSTPHINDIIMTIGSNKNLSSYLIDNHNHTIDCQFKLPRSHIKLESEKEVK